MSEHPESAASRVTGPVLVTGGSGFLGSHLVARLLAAGRSVTVVSRSPRPELEARGVRVVVGALHEEAVCAAAVRGAGTVFHVAARVGVWGREADFFRDNVLATRVLLAAARRGGVARFVHTSTPSVVYNGLDLAGVDEGLPLTTNCPSPYPRTKALAEREVLAANADTFRACALRPHLIWGVGDPHLVPRILARARAGRLRIVGGGKNRVDMVHVENATDAHLLAERALGGAGAAAGRAYFITNGEPVNLWDWVNDLLLALGEPPVTKCVSLGAARAAGALCEVLWRGLPLRGEPPMTRFIAAELAKDHWFSIEAARRDLGYAPRVGMREGTAALVAALRAGSPSAS
jgi:nucleoside-diphosphate-sugar epimerase